MGRNCRTLFFANQSLCFLGFSCDLIENELPASLPICPLSQSNQYDMFHYILAFLNDSAAFVQISPLSFLPPMMPGCWVIRSSCSIFLSLSVSTAPSFFKIKTCKYRINVLVGRREIRLNGKLALLSISTLP